MPPTFDSRRLRHQKAMDARLTADHRQLARSIAGLVLRAATARDAKGEPIIPQSRATRDALKDAIWSQVLKPYYIGPGTDALRGPVPQSPYAALLVEGIEKATRIQAERQTAIVKRLCKDPVVLAWLTGPRNVLAVREMAPVSISGRILELTAINVGAPFTPQPERGSGRVVDVSRLVSPKGMYSSFHEWVDPNGYRLSDRIWRTSIDVRARVDRLLDYHVAQGTSAVNIAKLLEPFMTPGGALSKTQTPYGSQGSYAARRLARTEITAAAGRATVNAAAANPFVERLQWRTSGSHPRIDICDANAHGGPNGDGIYPLGAVPPYPSHPNCCTPGQLVTTKRGPITIEQVRDGDQVLTHNGRYRAVLSAWNRPFEGQVYEIETDVRSFEVTGNHPVLTRRGWVNAECVQLGDEILYAIDGARLNLIISVADDCPAFPTQPTVAPDISAALFSLAMKRAVTFQANLDGGQGDVKEEPSDLVFPFVQDAYRGQSVRNEGLRDGGTCDPLVALRQQHGYQAGIAAELGVRDFASNIGPLGDIVIARPIRPCCFVPFLPINDGLAHSPHGDAVRNQQATQREEWDFVADSDDTRRKTLPHIDIMQELRDRAPEFLFDAQGMEFGAGQLVDGEMGSAGTFHAQPANGASNHDNLLSLSPVRHGGRGSGNPLVSEVANPTQALPNYSTVRAIRLRHYTGPVYNMEVADDHSFTVNGAAVHNCLCHLLPVPTGTTADLVSSLRADIQAARGSLVDAAGGGNAQRARQLQGILNPDYLTRAIMSGSLEDAILAALGVLV